MLSIAILVLTILATLRPRPYSPSLPPPGLLVLLLLLLVGCGGGDDAAPDGGVDAGAAVQDGGDLASGCVLRCRQSPPFVFNQCSVTACRQAPGAAEGCCP